VGPIAGHQGDADPDLRFQASRVFGELARVFAGSRSTVSPRAASTRDNSSAGMRTPAALTFSCTWSGRDAPMIAVATLSFCSTQAIASCAIDNPSSSATGWSACTRVGIVGGGPAGLMLSHLLYLTGIDLVVVDNRIRLEIEQTVRAGILERDSVRLLVDSGVSDRVLRAGHEHQGIDLGFAGAGHSHRLPGPDRLIGLALPTDRCLHRPRNVTSGDWR
jgi:hypothetical protein